MRRHSQLAVALALAAGAVGVAAVGTAATRQPPGDPADAHWPVTGGSPANDRYSPLTGITRENVARLQVAWTYHTGDLPPDGRGELQATPIVVGGTLYTTTPALAVVALDAARGVERWRFDPFAGRERELHANRGVAYWSAGADRRVLFTAGRRLYALDAGTGRPAAGFGDSGWVDLAAGLGRPIGEASLVATSPGAVVGDLLVQGTRVGEGEGAAPGHVRAYDVRTGRVRWTFHTIPQPGEPGHETWPPNAWRTAGGANAWAGMSVDTTRGLVFVPTGSASPDFYGGGRLGANLYANSLVALDARTGRRAWHFQTVHHDLLDRDLPAAPALLTVRHDGRAVDAVAQTTKSGYVFLFDRASGRPLFPVEERPAPASDLRGERAWPTQPVPTRPAPFARQTLTAADLTDRTPAARAAVLRRFRTLRTGGPFTPPSRRGSVVFPGFDGGAEWGGAAVDRAAGVLYVNANDVPWIAAMREAAPALGTARGEGRAGAAVYAANCAACHRADRRGDGDRVPSLVGVGRRRSADELHAVVARGRGFMPAFAHLPARDRRAVVAYLLGRQSPPAGPAAVPNASAAGDSPHAAELAAARARPAAAPYQFAGYERWRDPDGYPAVKPPWGTLSAIDLNTGEYRWRIPLGDRPEARAPGAPPTGTEQYGGPVVTAGGLVFIAATQDARIRAFDKDTGRLLWEAPLPAPGFATPCTYAVGGRQYLVVAAGGGKVGAKASDTYVAFALPE